jgi:cytochrome d ubiquinol oxidase subunit II
MLLLFALIIRGVSFELRGKVDDPRWRKLWDLCIFIGSAAPALLLGVAFANIFKGIPFDGDGVFHGTLLTLLNPYGLLGGALFVLLFLVHGAVWLANKTEQDLHDRAVAVANRLWPVLVAVAVIFLVASKFATRLYDNYLTYPVLSAVIALAVAALLAVKYFLVKKHYLGAWVASAVTIIGCTFYGVIGLFPNLYPSTIDAAFNLTARNASSSPLTLKIMLIVVVLFLPCVLAYQAWAYRLFYSKFTSRSLASGEAGY